MKAFSFFFLIIVLAAPLKAATFSVSTTTDAGVGTLRQAVLDSNGAGGANTIQWASSAGGTINLASALAGLAANTTLEVGFATSSVVIAGAPNAVPLAGAVTFSNNNNQSLAATVSAVVSGAGSLTKAGAGQINLTGANTYTGGTTLNAGTLGINSDAALGNAAGGVIFNGGTLQTLAGISTARNMTLNAGGATIDTLGFNSTFSGVLSGAGALTKTNSGTLTLTGLNTFQGGTSVNGGTLNVNADAALGNAAGGLTFNGGTLQLAASFNPAATRAIQLNSGGGTIDTNGFNATIASVISSGTSSGILTKNGLGTLTLTGANTYTGGTNILNGILNVGADNNLGDPMGTLSITSGTLQLAANFASTRTVSTIGSWATIDTAGRNLGLNGTINGGGPLSFINGGVVTLTGSNSYGGGTYFAGGTFIADTLSPFGDGAMTVNAATTLQLAASTGVIINNAITLNANASFDTNAGSTTLGGLITGTGALVKMGSGGLLLTNSNTYSGGTTISGGTLTVQGDAALGAAGVAITINGGELAALASPLTTNRPVSLGAGGGTLDTGGFDATLTGAISGGGDLTKAGAGTLVLSAVNTYAGKTTVLDGGVALGVSNALPATALTVKSGASFDLGGLTQVATPLASYVGAGTTLMTLSSAQRNAASPSLAVTGNANVTGGKLVVRLAPQVVKAGDTFQPINWGSVTGTLAAIQSPAAIKLTPTYNAGNLLLTASLVPFANIAVSGNQTAVGAALEPLRANPTGDITNVLAGLYTLDAGELRAALDQMGPASLGSLRGVGMAASAAHSGAVSRRLSALADAARETPGYSVSGPKLPGTLYAGAVGDTPLASSGGGLGRWGYFASGVFSGGKLSETNTGDATVPGYSFNSQGITAGADYRLDDNVALGAALGWLRGHASIYAPQSGTVDSQSARLGGYGTYFTGHFEGDLYLGGALDYFSTKRNINFVQISRTASGSPSGWELNVHPALRYDLDMKDWGIYSPFYGLSYDRLRIGSFSESGAGALDLNVGPQTLESLEQRVGLRYSLKVDAETFYWTPYVSLGWLHEYAKQSRPITASFAEAGGGSFQVMSGELARDGTVVGGGAAVDWTRDTTIKLDWTGDFRSHYQNSTVELALRSRF